MKYQKIVKELTAQLESADLCLRDREKRLEAFGRQLKIEEQKLKKIMKELSEGGTRCEIERQLGLVKEGYELLA
ncbi:MAG: hypothetical protein KDI68_10475 [Gammaproteobacteria bacterium]|nr:hypothetical protein [Gammaproteobacteria bacterium]